MDDNAPSPPAPIDARGQDAGTRAAGGEGIDGVDGGGSVGLGGGGGAAGATEVADMFEKVKAVMEYKARAACVCVRVPLQLSSNWPSRPSARCAWVTRFMS